MIRIVLDIDKVFLEIENSKQQSISIGKWSMEEEMQVITITAEEIAGSEELQEALAQKLETVRRSLTAEHDKIGEMIMAHGVIVNSTSVKAERLNAYRDGLRFALDLITRGGTK